jgi:hypothetical protein
MAKRTQGPFQDTKRNRQWMKLDNMLRHLEAGGGDHLFADAETKQFMMEDLKQEMCALVEQEFEAHPGLYQRTEDGGWRLVKDSERKVLPLRPK